jgi:hypothetical protein
LCVIARAGVVGEGAHVWVHLSVQIVVRKVWSRQTISPRDIYINKRDIEKQSHLLWSVLERKSNFLLSFQSRWKHFIGAHTRECRLGKYLNKTIFNHLDIIWFTWMPLELDRQLLYIPLHNVVGSIKWIIQPVSKEHLPAHESFLLCHPTWSQCRIPYLDCLVYSFSYCLIYFPLLQR